MSKIAAVLLIAVFAANAAGAEEPPAEAAPAVEAASAEPQSSPDSYVDPHVRGAAQDLERGDWREARRKAKWVLSRNKKSPEAWLVYGRTYLPQEKFRKAVRRFKKALKHDPHYAAAYYWKAKAFEAWGKVDEAANEYQAAFHADPKLEVAKSAWRRLQEQVPSSDE